jgi:hypothetical protein
VQSKLDVKSRYREIKSKGYKKNETVKVKECRQVALHEPWLMTEKGKSRPTRKSTPSNLRKTF